MYENGLHGLPPGKHEFTFNTVEPPGKAKCRIECKRLNNNEYVCEGTCEIILQEEV